MSRDVSNLIDELFEKEALFKLPGAIVGGLVGVGSGVAIGNGLADKLHRPTDEIISLRNDKKALAKDYHLKSKQYNDSLPDFSYDRYRDLVKSVNGPEFDNKTVGEVEDFADRFVNSKSLSKVASIGQYLLKDIKGGAKTGLAIAGITGALSGGLVYGDRVKSNSDSSPLNKSIRNFKSMNSDLDSKIADPDKISYRDILSGRDHQNTYSPSMLSDRGLSVGCEGESFYGENLNRALSDNNVDYGKIPWGQYKDMLGRVSHKIANGETDSKTIFETSGYKEASAKSFFEKEAFDIASVKRSASLISGGANRKASKDVSIAKDIASRYNKKTENSVKRLDGFQKQWDDAVSAPGNRHENMAKDKSRSIANNLDEQRHYTHARLTQNKKLGNNVDSAILNQKSESELTSSARKKMLGAAGGIGGSGLAGAGINEQFQNVKHADIIDKFFEKNAGYVGNFLGKNISKANNTLNAKRESLKTLESTLSGLTKSKGVFKKKVTPQYSPSEINKLTSEARGAVGSAIAAKNHEVGKTFATRLGTLGVGGTATGAAIYGNKKKKELEGVEPNYNENYNNDNYMYMEASEDITRGDISAAFEKTATKLDFSSGPKLINKAKDIATFARARRAKVGLQYAGKGRQVDLNSSGFSKNRDFLNNLREDFAVNRGQMKKLKAIDNEIKDLKSVKRLYNDGKIRPSMVKPGSAEEKEIIFNLDNSKRLKHLTGSQKAHTAINEYTKEVIRGDVGKLNKYRDNEIAKSLALYGGIGAAGKVTYDVNNSKSK